VVADYFEITPKVLDDQCRLKNIALARNFAWWVARQISAGPRGSFSFPEIGAAFGGRDHTTVMSGVRAIDDLLRRGNPEAERIAADLLSAARRVEDHAHAHMLSELVPRFGGFKRSRTFQTCVPGPTVARCDDGNDLEARFG